MHKVLFIAGLSNGETAAEEKGNYQTITGELSPWQRLQRYIADNGVEITSLSLYTRDGKRWTLPSITDRPKFHEFSTARKPVELKFFRKAAMEGNSPKELQEAPKTELHAVIEAQYDDGSKLQVWVDEETGNSWSLTTKP